MSNHSLGPDIFTGWKQNFTNYQIKQFPIYFTNPQADKISKSLTSFGVNHVFRVVYMGPRYTSNFKAFKSFSKTLGYSEQYNQAAEVYEEQFPKFQFKFSTERQKIFPIKPLEYRLFTGMNPTIKKDDLRFQSNFQCGNLDLAILINSSQYDLLMRVDSNTKGHTTWFYFKVSNFSNKQKVKFNIINFQKSSLLYCNGMKPYSFRSSKKLWEQEDIDMSYTSKSFRYNQQNCSNPVIKKCLSFTYQFKKQDKYVYFAYCVPYSYSYLIHQVNKLQKQHPNSVSLDMTHFSTGGLVIPILTITNGPNSTNQKQQCLAIGRLHPGETQGSWMMEGFMKYLCSPKANYLRQKMIFRIIPMVNVDGVVLGNFRTSISGRDLNRVFHCPQEYEQVNLVRSIAKKHNPLLFLDFHGHSAKKNVFMYGPDYGVDHKHYLPCRILPKLVSKATKAFRYYSCIFRISSCKVNAARSIMLKEYNVSFAYTIEASSHAYGPKAEETIFNKQQYLKVGKNISESLSKFLKIIFIIPKKLQIQRVQNQNQKQIKLTQSIKKKQKNKKYNSNLFNLQNLDLGDSFEKELLQQLIKDEKILDQNKNQKTSQNIEDGSDSDFQEGCDYSDKQLKAMMMNQTSSESPIRTKHKSKKKCIKKKHSIQNSELTLSVTPSKQNKTVELVEEISQTLPPPRPSPIKITHQRKIKAINIQSISPDVPKVKSTIIQPYKSYKELDQSSESILNKVHYKNWKKYEDNSTSETPLLNFAKANSVNRITLDYHLQNSPQESYQRQKDVRKRSRNLKLKYLKQKDKQKQKLSHIEQVFYVKESLLPILNKHSFNQRKSNLSLLQQLLEHQDKLKFNNPKKNLKIMYN